MDLFSALLFAFTLTTPPIEHAIKNLGDDRFGVRENASEFLVKHGENHLGRLLLLYDDADPEVAMRSRRVVERLTVIIAEKTAKREEERLNKLLVLLKDVKYYPYLDSNWYDVDSKSYLDNEKKREMYQRYYNHQLMDRVLGDFPNDRYGRWRAASKLWAVDMLAQGKTIVEINDTFKALRTVDNVFNAANNRQVAEEEMPQAEQIGPPMEKKEGP